MRIFVLMCAVTACLFIHKETHDKKGKKVIDDYTCTAVFVTPDKLLTAEHCIEHITGKSTIEDIDSKKYDVKVLASDSKEDIALLQTVKPIKHDYVQLGEKALPSDSVYTVNFEQHIPMAYGEGTVTGWKACNELSKTPCLVVSIMVAPGASGGGVFDAGRRLVGLIVRSGPIGGDAVDQPVLKKFLEKNGIK